jgi:hypothetical protein
MTQDRELQERVRRIEALVHQCEAIADAKLRRNVQQLLQAVMELHGAALDRLMTLVSDRGAETAGLIDELANDELVGNLLLLHGLHPVDLQTRVERALSGIEGILRGYGAHAEILGMPGGAIRLRVWGVTSAAIANSTRAAIEEAINRIAPDAASLAILGLEQFTSPDFVALDQLRMAPTSAPVYAEKSGG